MSDDLYTLLMNRIDEAFARHDSYYPILAHTIYAPLEGLLREAGPKTTCGKGCDACCSRIVVCSRIEALGMLDYLLGFTERTIEDLRKLIGPHASQLRNFLNEREESGDRDAIWFAQNVPCPFLAGGACSVYEARPLSCRTYHSTDEPFKCREAVRTVGQVQMLTDAEALFQVIVSRVAGRVDPVLAAQGLLTLMLDDALAEDNFKRENP